MRLRCMILPFLLILSSGLFSAELNPYFKDFHLGQSYQDVRRQLMNYKVLMKESHKKSFRMDVPLFQYLDFLSKRKDLHVDRKRERIYLDSYHFFDFKSIQIQKPSYHFFYDEPYHYLELLDIQSYPVNYPSRVNRALKSLKFKFFKKRLYCIEYSAKIKPYEIKRVLQKYEDAFGVKLDKKSNRFESGRGIYFVKLDPVSGSLKVIMTSKVIYWQIRNHIQSRIEDTLFVVVKDVEKALNVSFNLGNLLLEDRKTRLKNHLKTIYKSIDEL